MSLSGGNIAANIGAGNKPAKSGGAINGASNAVVKSAISKVSEAKDGDSGNSSAANEAGGVLAEFGKNHGGINPFQQVLPYVSSVTPQNLIAKNLMNNFMPGWGTAGFGTGVGASSSNNAARASVSESSTMNNFPGNNSSVNNFSGPGPAINMSAGPIDPLYKGPRPDNLTALNATNSGNFSFGTGSGTKLFKEFSNSIYGGSNFGDTMQYLANTSIEAGSGQIQHPRYYGAQLPKEVCDISLDKPVTGRGMAVLLIGQDGNSSDDYVGTEEGAREMKETLEKLGYHVQTARTKEEAKAAITNIYEVGKARIERGEGPLTSTLLLSSSHGGTQRLMSGMGGHNPDDSGSIALYHGQSYHEDELMRDAAQMSLVSKNTTIINSGCGTGSFNIRNEKATDQNDPGGTVDAFDSNLDPNYKKPDFLSA